MQGGAAGDSANHEDCNYTGITEDPEPLDHSGQPYPGDSHARGKCNDDVDGSPATAQQAKVLGTGDTNKGGSHDKDLTGILHVSDATASTCSGRAPYHTSDKRAPLHSYVLTTCL